MPTSVKKNKKINTFANQSTLPPLPIPKLDQTLALYKKTLRPLLNDQEYYHAIDLIHQFSLKLGPLLQSNLESYHLTNLKNHPNKKNWLEQWWYDLAYLTWRVPLMIHSNWWMNLKHDHLPQVTTMSKLPYGPGKFSFIQLRRAACLISNLLDYKDLLESENIPPEVTKSGQPLCMNQFRNLFGVTRIPELNKDRLLLEFPCSSTHICIMIQDQIFRLNVYTSTSSSTSSSSSPHHKERIPLNELEQRLTYLVHLVTTTPISQHQPPIGILTAEHRDTWAKARHQLFHFHPKNQTYFNDIETSLFVVSLDDFSAGPYVTIHHRWMAHGLNGHNRWFDKSINLIVTSSGQAGCCGEHAPQDALTPATLFEYAILNEKETYERACALSTPMSSFSSHPHLSFNEPTRYNDMLWLTWQLPPSFSTLLKQAELNNRQLIRSTEVDLLIFNDYGFQFIKSQCKVSPDAYLQMALQLAYYKVHRQVTSTYETASTRMYYHGRTETCRSCSMASKHFVEQMMNPKALKSLKKEALMSAIQSHMEYLRLASQGEGIDRHLLGLRQCSSMFLSNSQTQTDVTLSSSLIKQAKTFFEDPTLLKSSEWRLSTSGLSPQSYLVFQGTGFGAVHKDGYGINYFGGPNVLHFGLASYRTSLETCLDRFKLALVTALLEMKELFEHDTEVSSNRMEKSRL